MPAEIPETAILGPDRIFGTRTGACPQCPDGRRTSTHATVEDSPGRARGSLHWESADNNWTARQAGLNLRTIEAPTAATTIPA